jgi:hypothetical protein
VSFTIGGPSTTGTTIGTCTDSFMIGGATTTAPVICGVNSGQHSKFKKIIIIQLLMEQRS